MRGAAQFTHRWKRDYQSREACASRPETCGTDSPASRKGLFPSSVFRSLSSGFTLLELLVAVTITLLIAGLMLSGCYGPFELTRKVYHWNGQVSDNKWVVELVYLVCTWLPVYGIAGAADAIIFISVVFWTGKSMLTESAVPVGSTKRIARGDEETVMTRVSDKEMLIEQFKSGQPGASVRLRRDGDAVVALNADGSTAMRSTTQADGSVVVADASGQTVASYSAKDADQIAQSVQ